MIHNLISLASLASLKLSSQQLQLFAELNPLNIEGRYPGNLGNPLTKAEAESIAKRTKEDDYSLIIQVAGREGQIIPLAE